jgi:hypothetical protein
VKVKAVPAVAVAGALTMKWVAVVPAPLTVMVLLVPMMLAVTVSVAVSVWGPAVCRVALKVPVPAVKVLLAGRLAVPSLLVKWTVPV